MTPLETALLKMLQDGLPLTPHPFSCLADEFNVSEEEVVERLRLLQQQQWIRRSGIIVKHRSLGFTANAMVVWDIPDHTVDDMGDLLGRQDCVTLCYQRPRRLPDWPYNLFTMIHGKDRDRVTTQLEQMRERLQLTHIPYDVLFSERCFKQRGGRYIKTHSPLETIREHTNG